MAAAALEMLRRNAVDVLVLDLGLPDIDGFEVIGGCARQDRAVPIIVLSSRTDERGKVEALDLGADDYVTKPFGMEELLARMRAALAPSPAAGGREADVPQRRSRRRSGAPHRHGARARR